MPKHTVQENLELKKYEKDLQDIKDKRAKQRDDMRKKLEKKGYRFQKDIEKFEKHFNKKKKEGKLTEKDILDAFICLEITPMVHAATVQIRSGSENALLHNKDTLGKIDEQKARLSLPTSWAMTNGFMALIEPTLEGLQRKLKKFYKDLYTK